ncbi:MAG: glucose-6-phosphate isomerase family protein [Ignisphaera sp.]
MKKSEPISLEIDLVNGIMHGYTKKYEIKLSELKEYVYDVEEINKLINEKGDYTVYEVYELTRPSIEYEMILGITRIFPGTIGREYHFTRGHYHVNKSASIRGVGLVLMQNIHGDFYVKPLERGTVVYIPGTYAHRVVNISNDYLVFFYVYPATAGHDYETIRVCGFKKIVLNYEGGYKLIDNLRYEKCKTL